MCVDSGMDELENKKFVVRMHALESAKQESVGKPVAFGFDVLFEIARSIRPKITAQEFREYLNLQVVGGKLEQHIATGNLYTEGNSPFYSLI